MNIKLIADKVFETIPSEDELIDLSILESFYVIRKLKALVESLENGNTSL